MKPKLTLIQGGKGNIETPVPPPAQGIDVSMTITQGMPGATVILTFRSPTRTIYKPVSEKNAAILIGFFNRMMAFDPLPTTPKDPV